MGNYFNSLLFNSDHYKMNGNLYNHWTKTSILLRAILIYIFSSSAAMSWYLYLRSRIHCTRNYIWIIFKTFFMIFIYLNKSRTCLLTIKWQLMIYIAMCPFLLQCMCLGVIRKIQSVSKVTHRSCYVMLEVRLSVNVKQWLNEMPVVLIGNTTPVHIY